MKQFFKKQTIAFSFAMIAAGAAFAQRIPTLEMRRGTTPTNSGFGVDNTPMQVEFLNDALNNSSFTTNTPTKNVTVSFRNQQFTGLNYGSATAIADGNGGFYSTAQSTGLVFGAGPSLATDPIVFGATPYNRYNIIGEYGGAGGPIDNMFTSNPTATGAELGTGIKVQGSPNTTNAAFELFTTAQALYGSTNGIGSRVYFGDLVLTYNTPVKNPVIHVAGLGGSYRYLPIGATDIPANYLSAFFSTELELVNTGLTSTSMSGNQFFQVSGNNILNNNNANPNGGSVVVPGELFNNFGAATGSVRLNGTVQEVVYRVYLKSGTSSNFPWSVPGSLISGATRDPFTGDIWYVASSFDKPTQQISGNVFNDADGLTNNNINTTGSVANPKTNAGGLFANLLNSAGNVVASTPVSPEGVFLFDNVAVGNYSVQLTNVQGVIGSAAPATLLPAGWINTGENGSTLPGNGTGSDGTVNGRSGTITVNAEDSKVEVNFGIERLPNSVDFTTTVPKPNVGTVFTLNNVGPNPLPILSGNDPEDMPTVGVLTNKSVQITTLPTNTTLRYNGVNVTVGQVIPNFNPSLLSILVTTATVGATQTSFQYAYVDAAGKPDPTPATYTIQWQGILPVTLTSFDATGDNCSAKLIWVTASEVNASKFEVELSTDNGAIFNKVNTVAATGTSGSGRTYNSSYAMQTGVVHYFRLKIVNTDGSFSYSDIRKVSCTSGYVKVTLAPNPVSSSFMLRGMDNGRNQVSIYASNGQLMKTQVIVNTQGSVDVSTFAGGTYNVRIVNQTGAVTTIQMIKN